jgi:NADPH:quinone reductase-like Zn-dependent oxidoreductase
MHDIWTLRGVGHPPERLPMTLGCDAAGYDGDGNPVIVHPIIGNPDAGNGDETLDPDRALLSERHDGAFAEYVNVPSRNLIPKPSWLSFEEAACLPVAWGTAYRMLFTIARLRAGDRVLVQGAGGGVASAAIRLAAAAGAVVYSTSRDQDKREQAVAWGARAGLAPGERVPEKVDIVVETVGEATWSHSLKSLRPGGTLVLSGATSGFTPKSGELNRIFFLQLRVQGSTMGTRAELAGLLSFLDTAGVRPHIDRTLPLAKARDGFEAMSSGDVFGKIVFTV